MADGAFDWRTRQYGCFQPLTLDDSRVSVLESPDLLPHVLELVLMMYPSGSKHLSTASAVCKHWAGIAASMCHYPPAQYHAFSRWQIVNTLCQFGPTFKCVAALTAMLLYEDAMSDLQGCNGNFTHAAQLQLLELGLLDGLIGSLHAHPSSKGVQSHGLMLLMLFVKARDAHAYQTKRLLFERGIVAILVNAMRTHPLVTQGRHTACPFTSHPADVYSIPADGYLCCQELACRIFQGLVRKADDGWQRKIERAAAAHDAVPFLAQAIRRVLSAQRECVTEAQYYGILVEGVKAYGAILYAILPQVSADEAAARSVKAAKLLVQVPHVPISIHLQAAKKKTSHWVSQVTSASPSAAAIARCSGWLAPRRRFQFAIVWSKRQSLL